MEKNRKKGLWRHCFVFLFVQMQNFHFFTFDSIVEPAEIKKYRFKSKSKWFPEKKNRLLADFFTISQRLWRILTPCLVPEPFFDFFFLTEAFWVREFNSGPKDVAWICCYFILEMYKPAVREAVNLMGQPIAPPSLMQKMAAVNQCLSTRVWILNSCRFMLLNWEK